MKRMITEAMKLEVKKINKNEGVMGDMYQVGEYVVRIFNRPGRKLITCSCENGTRFPTDSTICRHKAAVMIFEYKEVKKE